MIRRYDLRRSDNYPYAGRKSYICVGSGLITVHTGFPVTSAIITWASVPLDGTLVSSYSSHSSISSLSSLSSISPSSVSSRSPSSLSSLSTRSDVSTSSLSSMSPSSLSSQSVSSSSTSFNSNSSSSSYSTSSSSSSKSSSSSSLPWPGPFINPRLYVFDYTSDGFRVYYENVPQNIGYVEFSYLAF